MSTIEKGVVNREGEPLEFISIAHTCGFNVGSWIPQTEIRLLMPYHDETQFPRVRLLW